MPVNTVYGQIWYEHINDIPSDWHLGFHIANKDTFYICSNTGKVYRSSNGGTNWAQVHSQPGVILQNIHFPSNNVGYVSGSNDNYLKTTDGGVTWNAHSIATDNGYTDVHFISDDIGFLAGSNSGQSYVWKTTNGGSSWTPYTLSVGSTLQDIMFVTDSVGYACGNNYVYKTTDQGVSWSVSYTAPNGVIIYEVDFFNSQLGIAVGGNGQFISRTTDGGNSWSAVGVPVALNLLTDILFTDSLNVYTVGDSYILSSNDAGASWNSDFVYSVDFPSFNWLDVTPAGKKFAYGTHLFSDSVVCNVNIYPVDTVLCEGEEVTLTADGSVNISWNNGVVNQTPFVPPVGITTYVATGSSGTNCQNSDSVTIEVLSAPAPSITQAGFTLSTGSYNGYQWYYNGAAITGGTTQSIQITQNGNYTVEVTYPNGCTRISTIYQVLDLSVKNLKTDAFNFAVFPNPATDVVEIISSNPDEKITHILLLDESGRVVLNKELEDNGSTTYQLDLSGFSKGVYVIRVNKKGIAQRLVIL